ncbi:MAG TPA: hypothetical protein VN256_07480 [Pyrinomonadaceae bacterium]|nr:hypothetical protein [Pyrinomonadaceae bacterium]
MEERYEALSPTEAETLRKKSRASLNILILIPLLVIGVTAWGAWGSWGKIIIIVVAGLLVIGFVLKDQIRGVQSLNRDIREGKKKIAVGRVESQRQDIRQTGGNSSVVDDALGVDGSAMSYSYLLKVRGKELKVSERQYYQCKPGQLVELHMAPHSEHVFFLKVFEDEGRGARPFS